MGGFHSWGYHEHLDGLFVNMSHPTSDGWFGATPMTMETRKWQWVMIFNGTAVVGLSHGPSRLLGPRFAELDPVWRRRVEGVFCVWAVQFRMCKVSSFCWYFYVPSQLNLQHFNLWVYDGLCDLQFPHWKILKVKTSLQTTLIMLANIHINDWLIAHDDPPN